MNELQLKKEYRVHVYETGPEGKLSLYSLFNFFQDVASEHAIKLGYGRDDLLKDHCFWVLSRMYAEITRMPSWEDTLIVTTWPRGTEKLFALRDYEACYTDGRLIASATSSWLIVHNTTRKIQRPDNNLTGFNKVFPENKSLQRNAAKLEPVPNNSQISSEFRVNISDLDVNLHTNNVNYIKWVTDSYDLEFCMKNTPHFVEINYLSESHYNDDIIIRSSKKEQDNNNFYNHSVYRSTDNTELCRIRMGWKQNNL